MGHDRRVGRADGSREPRFVFRLVLIVASPKPRVASPFGTVTAAIAPHVRRDAADKMHAILSGGKVTTRRDDTRGVRR
jgi:hypothetical protein